MEDKQNNIIRIIIGVVIVCLIIGSGWYIYRVNNTDGNNTANNAKSDQMTDGSDGNNFCVTDSDCVIVMTECGGDCGIVINKKNKLKYQKALEKKCKSYQGPFYKMHCSENRVKCQNSKCIKIK